MSFAYPECRFCHGAGCVACAGEWQRAERAKQVDAARYIARVGGEGVLTAEDVPALQDACYRVRDLMAAGGWFTAQSIIECAGQREGLRRLRELRVLGYEVEKRRIAERREFEYRLVPVTEVGCGEGAISEH